jgi:hypothetical protein
MKYLKLFEYFDKRDMEEAEYKRRNAPRYPLKHWDLPKVDITISSDMQKAMRYEWDELKKNFAVVPGLETKIKEVFKSRGVPLGIIDLPGTVMPVEVLQILFDEGAKSQQQMQQNKPKTVAPNPPKRQLGFRSSRQDDIGSENS